MNVSEFTAWLQLATAVLGGLAVLIDGLWAFTKYVVERGVLPPVQFSIEVRVVGCQKGHKVIEVLPQVLSVGTATAVIRGMSLRLLYLLTDDPVRLENAPTSRFGHARFTRSVSKELSGDEIKRISITPHDTFVQPGISQTYTLVTAVPEDASFLLVHCQFEYAQRPTPIQNQSVALRRRQGLIQYTLKHGLEPNTIERCIALGAIDQKPYQRLQATLDGSSTSAAES
jgi:hypothetical protein